MFVSWLSLDLDLEAGLHSITGGLIVSRQLRYRKNGIEVDTRDYSN
jgi:hypothetical protein